MVIERRWAKGWVGKGHRQSAWVIAAALAGMAALVLLPVAITGQWFESHERARYVLLLDHFRRAILAGDLYPRWLPDLFGGYGYPTFCFYQPGFFFAALPFSFLPGYPLSTLYVCTWLLLFIGALGAYKLARALADRQMAIACAALFMLTPYLYVDLYVRGDLSELAGLLLAPWPFAFLVRLGERVRDRRPVGGCVPIPSQSQRCSG